MMKLEWTNDLSVGNTIIDLEHKNLINIINDVMRKALAGNVHALPEAFELLENWLCAHFENKEKFAQAIKFPFDQHRQAQQYLLQDLQGIRNELTAMDGSWSRGAIKHFSRSLKEWMIDEHIFKLDMQMKPALQTLGYDFLPHPERGRLG